MKKPIAAIAAFVLGTTLLSGCFFVPPWWWGPDRDERWEGHHDRRRGELTSPDEQHRRNGLAERDEARHGANG